LEEEKNVVSPPEGYVNDPWNSMADRAIRIVKEEMGEKNANSTHL